MFCRAPDRPRRAARHSGRSGLSGPRPFRASGPRRRRFEMQVTETRSEGLQREFRVTLPATELEARLNSELENLKGRVKLNGFRPGKVPMGHLRRLYGRSVMADVVQNAVNEANRKIVEDNKLKLALEPKIELPKDESEVEKALEAKGDLDFTVAVEVLPSFELADLSDVQVTKQVTPVTDEELD